MADATIRRLTALQKSASTSRVLNLALLHGRSPPDPSLAEAPFFQHPLLNRCIIVKHRLRPNEMKQFDELRSTATKVMLPIDSRELKLGARYFFVGQSGFDQISQQTFGEALRPGEPDRAVLDLVDQAPSLDPFLLREQLRRNGIEPARAYFNISDADTQRMTDFVEREIGGLVVKSLPSGEGAQAHIAKLVGKLLSNTPDIDLGPLRETLRLNPQEYLDGVFAWRGFLYYKWVMSDVMLRIGAVTLDIAGLQTRGAPNPEASRYVAGARPKVVAALQQCCDTVNDMLAGYDTAFAALTAEGGAGSFRSFLLAAPERFTRIGELLGAVQHVVSFWRYRFPDGGPRAISVDELMDVLSDFEDCLAVLQTSRAFAA